MKGTRLNIKLVAASCVAALTLGVGGCAVSTNISVTNDGNQKEAELSAVFSDAQNYLSDCVIRSAQAADVATANSRSVAGILEGTIKARGPQEEKTSQGALFSALQEQYPDTGKVSEVYQNVMVIVSGCRTDFRDKQTAVLARVSDYNKWRNGSWSVRTFGSEFPSENLVATVGDKEYTGAAALKKMRRVVQSENSLNSYETGVITDTSLFNTGG